MLSTYTKVNLTELFINAGRRLKDPKTSFLNNVYFGRKNLEMRASKHVVNKQQNSRFVVIIPEPTARSAVPGVSPGRWLLIPH